jgi:hypothetical protein
MENSEDGKHCVVCGFGGPFRIVQDEWMKRTFRFVEEGQLKMCDKCGTKHLVCQNCGNLYCRIHPALEQWELPDKCPACGWVNELVKAWDGVSAR